DRVSLDLNGTVQDAMILLKSLLRQVNVESDLGDLPHIPGNRGELIQVWVNLIKNAGDSLLHDRTPDPQIRISSTLEGEWAVVRIRDNGPGIPAGIQGEIFQPNITTKVSGLSFGLGLGLPIVQRLVDGYGGKINFVSRPGETVFTVSLPVNGIPAGEKTA
ncbi:MAG TPA: HAMP domain-containing sensor histidine kinase, partial [Calditrichia bacterium]|nr:HAMP domain-containing sensor histidine kinase [Calditrichia bacterium]